VALRDLIVLISCRHAGIAIDGGDDAPNGTSKVPIALLKRKGRVAALEEEIEGEYDELKIVLWCSILASYCLLVCMDLPGFTLKLSFLVLITACNVINNDFVSMCYIF
jgi:hypothetical protein